MLHTAALDGYGVVWVDRWMILIESLGIINVRPLDNWLNLRPGLWVLLVISFDVVGCLVRRETAIFNLSIDISNDIK